MRVTIVANIPDESEELRDLLQSIRDWEKRRDQDRKLTIAVDCPTLTVEQVSAIYDSIRPSFEFRFVSSGVNQG